MPELMISIPLAKLKPSPTNPRKHLGDQAKIVEMATSMKEHGVLEPVIARAAKRGDGYELVCGHRRFAAAKLAELDGIPALVRELTDDQVVDIQIIENSHREDVHPLDEADAFAQAIERGRNAAEMAEKIGRPVAFVLQRLQLLKLCKPARAALDKDEITLAVAQLLARIPDAKLQEKALDDVSGNDWDGPMKAEAARRHIEERFMLRLQEAPFDIADAKLVAKAGACTACPKRTGAQRELFPDVKSPDVCTDPTCFQGKKLALFQIRVNAAKANGQEVLEGKEAEKALSYNSSFAKLDDDKYIGGGKMKSVRALIAKAKPPVVLAKGKDGEVHELVRNTDLQKVLPKEAKSSGSVTRSNAEKDRAAKDRRRAAAVNKALALAVERAGQLKNDRLIALLVRAMIAMAWNDTQTAVIRRRELEPKAKEGKKSYVPAEQRLTQYAAKLTVPELAALGLELALRRAAPHSNWAAKKDWGEVLGELKVDYAKIAREVDAEARAKAKARPKPKGKPQKKKPAATKATGKKAKRGGKAK